MGRFQIFNQRLDADTPELLVKSPDDQNGLTLSPDAAWILYFTQAQVGEMPPTSQRLMRFPASGGSPEQVLETPLDSMIQLDCPSRPSSSCVISRGGQGQLIIYGLDPLHGQGKELARTELGQASYLWMTISPDGSHIAIASQDQLREQVRIIDLQNGTERNLRLPQGSSISSLNWAADGNALVAALKTKEYLIVRIDLDGKIHILIEQQFGFVGIPCPSPDGHRLAYIQTSFNDNAWLLEKF